jgi:hypothetical protein
MLGRRPRGVPEAAWCSRASSVLHWRSSQKPKTKSQKLKAKSWKPKDLKDIAMKKIVGVPVKGRGPGVGDL